MSKYRVKDGTRVVVGGTAYSNGATFTAEPADVQDLLANGWISETSAKAVHRDQAEDKAVTPRRRTPRTT